LLNPEQFEQAVDELSARAGGDEPEMFYGVLLNAVVKKRPKTESETCMT
jgi:hypothetical protein